VQPVTVDYVNGKKNRTTSVRFDEALLEELDAFAHREKITRAQALRRLVEDGLHFEAKDNLKTRLAALESEVEGIKETIPPYGKRSTKKRA